MKKIIFRNVSWFGMAICREVGMKKKISPSSSPPPLPHSASPSLSLPLCLSIFPCSPSLHSLSVSLTYILTQWCHYRASALTSNSCVYQSNCVQLCVLSCLSPRTVTAFQTSKTSSSLLTANMASNQGAVGPWSIVNKENNKRGNAKRLTEQDLSCDGDSISGR